MKGSQAKSGTVAAASQATVLHELQVHQVELEAQNSELARLKHELECTLEGYTALYENAPIAYLNVGPDARIMQTNRKGVEMLGAPIESILGHSLLRFFGDVDAARVSAALRNAGAPALLEALELELLPLGQGKRCVVSLQVTLGSQAGSALVMMSDLTERRELEQALLDSSHRERLRLAADIHDGLAQELSGICMRISAMARESERHIPLKPDELRDCLADMVRALGECRSLARGLSPLAAYEGGLVEALRQLALHSASLGGPSVVLDLNQTAPIKLAAGNLDHLYRIAQEGVSNARRHSGARSIAIRLDVQPRSVILAIVDDGCGIGQSNPGAGLGLRLMRHRAALMGAQLSVQSVARTNGTQILCRIAQPAAHHDS